MIPGFEDGILGHKGGEEFEINVTFPARYHVKDLAGKPVVFKIKLHRRLRPPAARPEQRFCQEDGQGGHHGGVPRPGPQQQLYDGKHAGALNRAKDVILDPAGRCR